MKQKRRGVTALVLALAMTIHLLSFNVWAAEQDWCGIKKVDILFSRVS